MSTTEFKKHTRICPHYRGECNVTNEFCARRFHRAKVLWWDGTMDHCRACFLGEFAYDTLKGEIEIARVNSGAIYIPSAGAALRSGGEMPDPEFDTYCHGS